MYIPKYDKTFKAAIWVLKDFAERVKEASSTELNICLERDKGYNYFYKMNIFKDNTGHDEENYRIAERIIKTLLWLIGGYKIYLNGSDYIYKRLAEDYSPAGKRAFDWNFMSRVYENKMVIINSPLADFPEPKEEKLLMENDLSGCRIGFDAGGSDRKVSALQDGEIIFSDETVWFPKINADPAYHYEGILDSINRAAKYLPRVDSIGISTAGIVVANKMMVSSLFMKVEEKDYDRSKNIYIDVAKNFGDIPLVVANDGDVTALAGAIDLNQDRVLGLAMGTSEAAGYIGRNNCLMGWLNELAFVPVDLQEDAPVDEWSGDIGCGAKYFSQDAVIRLSEKAGIVLDSAWPPARKLKYLQDLNEAGDARMKAVFNDIGIYLGYSLAYYALFYDVKHVLLLGRVVSGKGGNMILNRARKVLYREFPEMARTTLHMPSDKMRRVGQAIAAAGLPILK